MLGGTGTEINFLKRRLVMLSDGMMKVPGTSAAKVVEKHFGHARVQKVPCDSASQQEDNSKRDWTSSSTFHVTGSISRLVSRSLRQLCPHHPYAQCKDFES